MGIGKTGIELGPGRFDEATDTERFEYDEDETAASMAAVAAVAAVSGEDFTDLTPIQENVDCDALDLLIGGRITDNGDVHVTWTQDDYTVTVHSYGVVAVASQGDTKREPATEEGRR